MSLSITDKAKAFVEKIRNDQQTRVNYALIVNKAAWFNDVEEKFVYMEDKKNLYHLFTESKHYTKNGQNQIADAANGLVNSGIYCAQSCSAEIEWRLACGLGIESIYETGMAFHPVYGIPYLPASSIKGLVRSYVIETKFENEKEALEDQSFCFLFGCDESGRLGSTQGNIIFFDSFPDKNIKIEPDIMNPHFGDYYGDETGNTPPADWLNPVPIIFLTSKNANFQFHVAVKKKYNKLLKDITIKRNGKEINLTGKFSEFNLLTFATTLLTNALKEHGIGAKTAVDYGKLF